MSETIRLTVGQAVVRFLGQQYVERDGERHRLVTGIFGIFGHGNVCGVGQALLQDQVAFEESGADDPLTAGHLPYYLIRNEQSGVHAATAFARAKNVELFNEYQQTVNRDLGALNTFLLITGSWFVVRAVQAAHRDDLPAVPRNILLGFLCGGGFLVVKVIEYAAKFGAGITMSTNTFYLFYISLTFFHFRHVILGMVILAVIWTQARKGAYTSQDAHGLESGAAYWHMVDLLWIILFPLVYVMR